jgi:dipeptidyl aminopeptidase/acylaminoacyl peptidase
VRHQALVDVSFAENLPPYWQAFIGNPKKEADRADMVEKSPLSHIDRIERPLLAFQSVNDVRIKREQFDRLVAAMRKAGKQVEPVEFKGEGHSLRIAEAGFQYYRDTERFLARHLGGRTGP